MKAMLLLLREAVEALERKTYDAILMDCQMPELDGYQTTREMRARGLTMPVIAMTANALASDRERCLEAGMSDHLAKPFGLADLWSLLARWLPPTGTRIQSTAD